MIPKRVAFDELGAQPTGTVNKERTEPGDEIIENRKRRRLPPQLCRERAVDRDEGRDGKDGQADVVKLLPPVLPCYGREGLGSLEGVVDVVVRDVHVCGGLSPESGRL